MSILPAAPQHNILLQASLDLMREPERDLLTHLAPLASFDRTIVGQVGRDIGVAEVATLADLAEYRFILEVRDKPSRYRIRDDMRRVLLNSWWEGERSGTAPDDLPSFCERLARQLERIPGTDEADLLNLRLFASPLDALTRWKDLYSKADKRFDLVRCRSLIGMLSWVAAVSPEIDGVREDYETYLAARGLWTDEWYRTGSFVLPDASREVFESLLRGDRGRVLELQGFGGYGKTMHLRWLIARRCVPADARIPCARIDFDTVDPFAATRDPHLVLLELADQLDRQLPGDAFGKLVRTYAADRALLYRRRPEVPGRPRDIMDSAEARGSSAVAGEVQRRFCDRLTEIPEDQPVVLVLDTLEVPLHLPDTQRAPAVKPLLTDLAEAARADSVRLILAGRYEIPADVRNLFSDWCEPFRLPRFTDKEARTYLVGKRMVKRQDHVLAAIEASEHVPFSLALLADLIEEDPEVSPDTIVEYRGAEFAYLIERVVKRISELPVRWVLRYAALPRRFDYEFVRDVIWPRVREGMGETGDLDRPADDNLPQKGKNDAWPAGPAPADDEQAVRQVWNQIRRYASGSSWLSTDRTDPRALRLQTEVVRPLRDLLREKPIYAVLHADASEYFLRRAAEGARSAEFLHEAVYHRFQSEGVAASAWWEEQIRTAAGPTARRALAGELARRPEYTDQADMPAPRGGDVILVPGPTLQRARLEFCIASAELATLQAPLQPQHGLWQDASDALDRVTSLPDEALSHGRLALARSAVALGARQHVVVSDEFQTALDSPDLSPRERFWLTVLHAYRLVADGSADAGDILDRAGKLEQNALEEYDVRRLLAFGRVRHLRDRGTLTEAIAECTAAIGNGLGGDADFYLFEAAMRLTSGDTERARAAAEKVVGVGAGRGELAQVLLARCWRREHRFGLALAGTHSLLTALAQSREASQAASLARGGALREIGDIEAVLLRVGDARKAYADATRMFGEAQEPEAIARCHLREAVLLLTGLGHLRAAGVALDNADRAAPEGGMTGLLAQLTRVELVSRLGDHAGAATILTRLESPEWRTSLPPRMAATAVAGVAFGPRRERDRYIKSLAEGLGQITPPIARLQLLSRVDRCPVLRAQTRTAKKLREAVIPPAGWEAELAGYAARDRALLRIRAAAFARLVGDHNDACTMLRTSLREIDGDEEPLAGLLEVLRLARQLREADLVTAAGQAAVACAEREAEEHPLLAAAAVIEYLEAAGEPGANPIEGIASACARAEAWLDNGGLSAEAWRARLNELYAMTSIADFDTAASYREAAVRLYDAAGDVQKAEKVAGPGSRLAPTRTEITVDLALGREGEVKSKIPGWRFRLRPRRRETTADVLRSVIKRWIEKSAADPYPPELPGMMAGQWSQLRTALADLLGATEVTKRRRRQVEPPDLSVCIHDGALQPFPWELAASKKQTAPLFADYRRAYRQPTHAAPDTRLVRLVQAGLNLLGSSVQVDGVSGPDTARALRQHAADPNSPDISVDDPETIQRLHLTRLAGKRPGVIVVRPGPTEGLRPSLTAERRYAHVGYDVTTVDQMQISALTLLLRADKPPVIVHIVGGMVARGGVTAIDLQQDAQGWGLPETADLLTAADLDHAFRGVPRDWPTPVVVLDVPAPTGLREIADQMLLRNCFAADLFAMGGSRAVVGAGLADRTAADLVQDVLLEGLASGDAIGDVIQRMRQQAPPSGSDEFQSSAPFAGIALWCNDPSLRLPPLGGM